MHWVCVMAFGTSKGKPFHSGIFSNGPLHRTCANPPLLSLLCEGNRANVFICILKMYSSKSGKLWYRLCFVIPHPKLPSEWLLSYFSYWLQYSRSTLHKNQLYQSTVFVNRSKRVILVFSFIIYSGKKMPCLRMEKRIWLISLTEF